MGSLRRPKISLAGFIRLEPREERRVGKGGDVKGKTGMTKENRKWKEKRGR